MFRHPSFLPQLLSLLRRLVGANRHNGFIKNLHLLGPYIRMVAPSSDEGTVAFKDAHL